MKLMRPNQHVTVDDNLKKWLGEGEEARVIPEAPHYAISNTGRIFSGKEFIEYEFINGEKMYLVNWKELFPHITRGYWSINLSYKGKVKKYYLHDLIYRAFVENYSKYYFKIIFADGCRDNLHVSNLKLKFKSKKVQEQFDYRVGFYDLVKNYTPTPINF